MKNETVITKDLANKKLHITRYFAAPVAKVWKAWTDSSVLDKWWAPKPWKAETKIMDFKEGGFWLYCMAGPNGERSWCRVDFTKIDAGKSFAATACFCDEDGNINSDFPKMYWNNVFEATETGTKLEVDLSFDSEDDLEKIVAMGFEGGFTMGLNNLAELLAAE
ncbi:SRPBCC family protein [Mucilaginibacter flavus]|uniref:SRPBCC family protein n=1 Tax=Mucilaginibacter flavus TaxID=931504 RepID=UPI0025B4EB88|nr:SRPBCC domain-containing protein [Mucilaginibacter flavus]MDN3579603.1 SRPBCC domain-containing protein [Mucilaginibacter flavus]